MGPVRDVCPHRPPCRARRERRELSWRSARRRAWRWWALVHGQQIAGGVDHRPRPLTGDARSSTSSTRPGLTGPATSSATTARPRPRSASTAGRTRSGFSASSVTAWRRSRNGTAPRQPEPAAGARVTTRDRMRSATIAVTGPNFPQNPTGMVGIGPTIAVGGPWAAPGSRVAATPGMWEADMSDYVHPETLVDADWVAQ